jgi:hypothetical protein
MQIIANNFVKRQTSSSRFSHFDGGWEDLESLVQDNWENAKPGYRAGVILIRVPSAGFYSPIVDLKDGDKLIGAFEPRREGEHPRKFITTDSRRKSLAKTVDVVLYSSVVLAEDGDNDLPSVEDNWEIISINASIAAGDTPISPMILMHNHFGSDGGTATYLSDSDFIATLQESFYFWRDKAGCG